MILRGCTLEDELSMTTMILIQHILQGARNCSVGLLLLWELC